MRHLSKFNFTALAAALTVICSGILLSCSKSDSIVIAEQYGLAYAPLQIMRANSYLEQLEPDVEFEWVKLGNTAAIREAVLAGEVALGFMGLPPFLIGADKGMDWKLVAGLSVCPVGLAASGDLKEFGMLTPDTRIALPQPGSIQHILLSMAAERRYGNAAYFDSGLVTMKHPDGMTALFAGAVDAHFTSPPYIFLEEAEEGINIVLKGDEAFGGRFSFIGAMAAGDFIEEHPEVLDSFLNALNKAVDFINEEPEKAAELLSEFYDMPQQQILEYISYEGMEYTTRIYGLERFIEFMNNADYLSGETTAEKVLYTKN